MSFYNYLIYIDYSILDKVVIWTLHYLNLAPLSKYKYIRGFDNPEIINESNQNSRCADP